MGAAWARSAMCESAYAGNVDHRNKRVPVTIHNKQKDSHKEFYNNTQ